MIRLSRAVALTAVTLALPLAPTACNKQDKPAEVDKKAADSTSADSKPGAAPSAATGAPKAAQVPPPPAGGPTPPGMPAAPAAPAKKPDSVKPEHVKAADNIVEATSKFSAALEATKGDCKKATAVVKNESGPLKSAMADTQKLQNDLKGDQQAIMWFQQTYAPKMMGSLQKMGMVVQQCSKDKEFADAFQNLGLGGPPRRPPPPASHGSMSAPPAAPAAPAAPDAPKSDSKK
ncbi:MAG TPA: hypothetical protein VKB80_26965 [Kofleriaceae bacterium]|nr:hypothetical protein [Kofleriaceae bacterium]